MAIYFKPIDVPDNSFTAGLKGVSTDAFAGYTENANDGNGLFVEWNDEIAPFPSADVINAHADKASWKNVRRKRNQLLAETDYLALSDNTLSDEQKIQIQRQTKSKNAVSDIHVHRINRFDIYSNFTCFLRRNI